MRDLRVEDVAAQPKGAIKIGPFGSALPKSAMVKVGVKVYGQENVIGRDWALGERRVSNETFHSLRTCELQPGDVVIGMMGSLGHCEIFPADAEPGLMDSHLLRIQVDPKTMVPEYLRLLLLSEDTARQIDRMSHGTIMAGLSSKVVKRIRFPVPSLGEQRQIAEILDTIDETIRATERVIAKRRRMLLGLQQTLCGDGASTTAVHELVSRQWSGEWGEESHSEGLREVLVLRATNLDDYSVDYSTGARRFVPESKITSKKLEDGDLLVEGAGGGPGVPVGRVARFVQPDDGSAYLTSNFFRALRPASGVDSDYLFWLLDYEYRKPSIWSCQQQTTGIINLKLQDYLERRVSFRRDEQIEIAGGLNAALRAIETEFAAADKLRQIRAGLAADLLSGQVRTVST